MLSLTSLEKIVYFYQLSPASKNYYKGITKNSFGFCYVVKGSYPEYDELIGTHVSATRVREAFESDIQITIDDCKTIFENFDDMPEEAQHVFAGMIFQLGRPRFSKFKKSIQFAKEGAWDKCATEILDSRWAKQTPNRAGRYSARLASLAIPV